MKYALLALLLSGCGYSGAHVIRPGVYGLGFCQDERDCFEAAKDTCPNGYEVTRWSSASKPIEFVCK